MDRPTAASRHLLETFSHDTKFAFKLQIPILYGMRCLFEGSKISEVIFMNTSTVQYRPSEKKIVFGLKVPSIDGLVLILSLK